MTFTMTASTRADGIDMDRAEDLPRPSRGLAFASVELHRDMTAIEPLWAGMLGQSLATAYQKPAFLRAWLDHVAASERVCAAIVVARDVGGRPVALLPFGVKRRLGVRIAGFLGGSHSNFNAPVIRLDALASFTPTETIRLLREAARAMGADAFALCNQPEAWLGAHNPFVTALPRQPSPDPAFSGPLAADAEAHFKAVLSAKTRSKQRRKMRRFEEIGTPRLFRADTPAERSLVLDSYLDQKRQQLSGRGIASVFDREGVRAFLADACGLDGSTPAVDLYGFALDGEIIAVTGVLPQGARLSGMLNSIQMGENAKYSPGELLLVFVVEDAIRRGFTMFDLGVGVAPYKTLFCPNTEQLYDSMLGVTALGRTAAAALSTVRGAKARIKANPAAYGLVERVRKLVARRSRAAEADAGQSSDAE